VEERVLRLNNGHVEADGGSCGSDRNVLDL